MRAALRKEPAARRGWKSLSLEVASIETIVCQSWGQSSIS